MNEANVRQEVYRLLRQLGYTPHRLKDAQICPVCHSKVLPPTGRPDILVNNVHGPGCYVEVKALNVARSKSFAFSEISPEQRCYLSRRTDDGFRCYIALGTVNAPRKGSMTGRHLWIVDWNDWLAAETEVEKYQKSFPLMAGKGFNKSLQENQLDLIHLFTAFECSRQAGRWLLPEGHSLWQGQYYDI